MHSGFSADPSQPHTAPLPAISELKNFLSAELASFKDELKRQNDESINFAVKKIRLEISARHTYKYKGNEEQYQHQEKVASHIDTAVDALHSGKLVEAANALEEGKNSIAIRMKHIVLAWLGFYNRIKKKFRLPKMRQMKSEFVRYSRKSEIKERRKQPKELRKLIS